jgi:hypothetical protein
MTINCNSPTLTDAVGDAAANTVDHAFLNATTDSGTDAVTDSCIDAVTDTVVDELGGGSDSRGLHSVSIGGAMYEPGSIPWHRSRPATVTSALLVVCRVGD